MQQIVTTRKTTFYYYKIMWVVRGPLYNTCGGIFINTMTWRTAYNDEEGYYLGPTLCNCTNCKYVNMLTKNQTSPLISIIEKMEESCQVYVVFVFMGALRVNSSLDTWGIECMSCEAISLIFELIDYLAMCWDAWMIFMTVLIL